MTPAQQHLAASLSAARRRRGRLVLRCGQAVAAYLHQATDRASYVPPPALATGTGATYTQVEVEQPPGFAPGRWQLARNGEVIADGDL